MNILGKTSRPEPQLNGRFARLGLVIIALLMAVPAFGQTAFYVSPSGSDANPGTQAAPFQTVAAAQAAVRALNGTATSDINVYLSGGLYRLTNSLVFTSADSGQNGYHVIYQALSGQTPVLDGGILVTNWTLHDAAKNIWQATVPAGTTFRQLYVNGVKANFSRSADALGLTQTSTGYSTANAFLRSLSNSPSLTSLEVVTWPQWWQREVLPVAGITPGGSVTLQQPCWNMVKSDTYPSYKNPQWLQNAYEFLANPGDWYLQSTSNTVYYIPRPGDNMATAVVEAPVLERLIYLQGTKIYPIINLRFQGLSFQMTTWNLVGPGYGLPESQANQPQYSSSNWVVKAAVDGAWLRDVDVSQCQFYNLGGDGVNVLYGSKYVAIDHCLFHDLSASAIQVSLGWTADTAVSATDPSIVENIVVANNTIHDVNTDYPSGCGIYVGYTRNCSFIHNLLYNLPYTGISMGWGWNQAPVSFTSGNWLDGNLIHDHIQLLGDGGAIYVNGAQYNATVSHNYCYNQGNYYGVLYFDSGSENFLIFGNVIKKGGGLTWFGVNTGASNSVAYSNFTDDGWQQGYAVNNTVVANDLWPPAAQAITNAAGPLSTEYYSSFQDSFLISASTGNGGFNLGLAGWTVGGPTASQAGIVYGQYADSSTPIAHNAVSFNAGNNPPGGTLSKSFNALSGHTYNLSYSQATWGQANNQSLAVSINTGSNAMMLGTNTTWFLGLYARFGFTFIATNTGTYTVVFTDVTSPSSATNSDCALTRIELRDVTPPPITAIPTIVAQPANPVVIPGTTLSLNVGNSNSFSTFQWYQNGSILAGQTNATLVLNNVTTNMNGFTYQVSAAVGDYNATSAIFTLTVLGQGSTYYFDVNGATAGSGVANSGSYNWLTNPNWSTDSTGSSATSAQSFSYVAHASDGDNAVFVANADAGTDAFTVNITGFMAVHNLTVNSGNLTINTEGNNWVLNGTGDTATWTVATGDSLNVVGNNGFSGALNMDGNSLLVDVQGAGSATIAGMGNSGTGLTKNGTGTLTLSAACNYSGATTINGGTLTLGNQNGLNNSSAITVSSGATLNMNAASANTLTVSTVLTLNGGTLSAGAGAPLVAPAGYASYGNFYLDNSGAITVGANTGTSSITAVLGLNGSGINGDSSITVGANSTLVISGAVIGIPGLAYGGIAKSGAGTLEMTGNNAAYGNYYGGMIINSGTVEFAAGSLGSVYSFSPAGTYTADFEGSATLQWAPGNTQDISSANGMAQIKIADNVTATLDTGTNNVNLGTAFTLGTGMNGALTKAGPGTLTLSAANNYTGTTTLSAGTLALGANSVLASGTTVNLEGGTLAMGTYYNTVHALQSRVSVLAKGTWGASGSGANHISADITGSGILTVSTGGASTSVVTSSGSPSTYGNSVTFTNTVTGSGGDGSAPSGTVTFYDGVTPIGTGTLIGSSGTVSTYTLTINTLTAATHSITASYAGNASYDVSGTSGTLTQVVNPATPKISPPTNGVVNITFYGIPGTNYVVQTTTNLSVPWWPLSTNTASTDGSLQFTDPNATNQQQYYRSK